MERNLIVYESHEGDFFEKMGCFFAFRDYAKEMGGWQFYTKKGSIWFVLFIHEKVAGFCSAIKEKTHWYYDNFYILQKYRGLGYSKILHAKRNKIMFNKNKEIRVITDNEIQLKYYRNHKDFEEYGRRGKYTKFRRNI